MRFLRSLPVGLALLLTAAHAQTPDFHATAAYDVATVKPNTTGPGHSDIWTHDNSYIARNVELKAFLQDAFDTEKDLIVGLPPWAESSRWDLDAKNTDLTLDQLRSLSPVERGAMLRRVLEDRFALKWHFATEIRPVYNLVVDKSGIKFQHTTAAQAAGSGDGVHARNNELGIQNVGLDAFCKILSDRLEKPVLDRTGLTGKYTLLVRFTPDSAIAKAGDAGLPADAPPPLFTALPEQLGLRLESGKGPVQTLVIDSISPPTAN